MVKYIFLIMLWQIMQMKDLDLILSDEISCPLEHSEIQGSKVVLS